MSPAFLLLLIVFIGSLSALLTMGLRAYALAHDVLDIPNARSSHSTATPRGGGLAMVCSFAAGILCVSAAGTTPVEATLALLGGGALVALVGFMDDHARVAARWRLLAHGIAAAWVLYWTGTPRLDLPGGPIDLGWFGWIVFLLYLVWMLNLYNFMDGIDGLAGIEAVSVGVGSAAVYGVAGLPWSGTPILPVLLAAAAAGFLLWNFPPAKIFMGDVGSGFLGLMLGALSVQAAVAHPNLLWSWVVLLGVFIVDATLTLMRRLWRGERIYEAHRSHAYQNASRQFGAHRPVTLAVAAINVLWLLPCAIVIAGGWVGGFFGTVIAYFPLLLLALRFRAGLP